VKNKQFLQKIQKIFDKYVQSVKTVSFRKILLTGVKKYDKIVDGEQGKGCLNFSVQTAFLLYFFVVF
jgi:hypothetical protein